MYDIIIIGCGTAGMTAGIYALRDNKKILIFEGETIGGQIYASPLVENYPGFIKISGTELSDNLYNQVKNLGGVVKYEKVIELKKEENWKIKTNENTYISKAVILATGAKHRILNLENEKKFIGNGISFCTTCDGPLFRNKIVAIIGGGNSAVTNTIYFSDMCSKVYLIHRSENFKCDETLLEKLKSKSNAEIITNSNVIKYIGEDYLEGIIIENNNKETREIELNGLFLSIGNIPQNELVKDLLKLNENGSVISNENCETEIQGLFVAGDIRDKKVKQLTTAVSDGTIAAINAIKYVENK